MRRFFRIILTPFCSDARGDHGKNFDQHLFHYVFSCRSFPKRNVKFVMQWIRIAQLTGVYNYAHGGISGVSLRKDRIIRQETETAAI
jgi:hypothetical protein